MARTGESGSWWMVRRRETTASREVLVEREGSWEHSGKLRDGGRGGRVGVEPTPLAFADELVSLQSGGDLIGGNVIPAGFRALGANYLADTAQVDGLRAVVIEGDDVFDRTTQIGFPLGSEQDSCGTNVLGESGERDSFGSGTGD